jgi:hypothetical protein
VKRLATTTDEPCSIDPAFCVFVNGHDGDCDPLFGEPPFRAVMYVLGRPVQQEAR